MLTISYFGLNEFSLLEEEWTRMEKGTDMSYFQSYSWNSMLANLYYNTNNTQEVFFIIVRNDSVAKVIAPIIVYRKTKRFINHKGIYLWGRKGWSDYLNFVYEDFDEDAIDYLLSEIKKRFGLCMFYFEQVNESTYFYRYLKRKAQIIREQSTVCVGLELPSTVDEYMQMLSKHTRQNIRTAINRQKGDGLCFSVRFNDTDANLELCKEIREKRIAAKQQREYESMSLIDKIRYKIKIWLADKYPTYLPFITDPNSKILSIYDGDALCAYFNFGYDSHHHSIVLMAVGTNDLYAKYSPGLYGLFSFICSLIEDKQLRYIDFTRGDEPYKLALGGKTSNIYSLSCKL